jgi:hypothetical protein
MKSLVDDMASDGKKFDDEELCSYIQLLSIYNSFVSSIVVRVEPVTIIRELAYRGIILV